MSQRNILRSRNIFAIQLLFIDYGIGEPSVNWKQAGETVYNHEKISPSHIFFLASGQIAATLTGGNLSPNIPPLLLMAASLDIMRASLIPPSSVISAIAYCLRPMVHLCIHFGVDYRQLTEILKGIFVSVCDEHYAIPGKPQTDSRISLLTGVHRKDVKRLRGSVQPGQVLAASHSIAANVISYWLGKAEFLSPDKEPRPLPRTPVAGQTGSFEELVGSLTLDIRPAVVLEELVRAGVVSVDHEDVVHLDVAALIPDKSIDDKAYFLSQTIHDHIAAAGHNLAGGRPPFLDRFVWHGELTEDQAARIARTAEKAAMRALKTVNEEAVAIKAAELKDPAERRQRIHFGTFFFNAEKLDAPSRTDT